MVKASPELVERYEQLLDVVPGADRKLVFGSPTCLVGGNMFFGVHSTGLFVKLPPDAAGELLADGGTPFSPMPGRPMGGFYVLPEGDVTDWVRRSYEYAQSLPAKAGRQRKGG
jgi:TfoX N-terminal domain